MTMSQSAPPAVPTEPSATLPDEFRALGLEAVGISKHFGDFTALDNVTIKVQPGTVHALLGENGAGKSTLVKCIMGYYRPDSGGVIVGQHEQLIDNPRQAHAIGIGMVYQHFTLVPSMTVLENLVMARPDVPARIDWAKERRAVEAFMDRMPFSVPLDKPAATLAAGEKQKVEILKQIYLDARFLILDEPTSVLTPDEADEILGLLRDMARAKNLTILIITHKFREVFAFADAVSVLRRGKLVGGGEVRALSADDMARMMIGDGAAAAVSERTPPGTGAPALEITELVADDDAGKTVINGVSLLVRPGEIVGIAGVSGNGQSELVEILAGQRSSHAGHILVQGEPYDASRRQMLRHKVSLLPEEPLQNACVGRMSVADNMAFRQFDQPPYARGGWWLSKRRIRAAAREMIARYNVRTPGPDAPIASLSGGNVQRAVLARELGGAVNVLIAANPVFGLDFAAVADIHAQIVAARNRGAAVLLISEDLDELIELADRILVMSEGRIVHHAPRATADRTTIGHAMAGHQARNH